MVREVTSTKSDIDCGHTKMRRTCLKRRKKEYEAINVFM